MRVAECSVGCLCCNVTDSHPSAPSISLQVFNVLFCWARCTVAKFPSCKKGHRKFQRKYIAYGLNLQYTRRVAKCGITVSVLGKIKYEKRLRFFDDMRFISNRIAISRNDVR